MTLDRWKDLTLADIATIVGGGTPSRRDSAYWDGDVPWATPTDVTGLQGRVISKTGSMITDAGLESSSAALLPSNSLLMTTRATIGACAINDVPMATNQGFQSLVPKRHTDIGFLYYLILHSKRRLERLAAGSTFLEVSKRTVRGFRVIVPPLPDQRKIAAILSSVDDAIEKTQAVIDQVQVVKRGLMQELLTRGLPGRHTRFKQTEIGEIPEGWRTSGIGEIASCDYGTSESLQGRGSGREIPILRMGNLRAGRVSLDHLKYLAAERVPDELFLSSGDVLFNRTNSADLVGKVAVFDNQAKVSFASYLLRLRVEPRVGSGFWLSYLLNTETLQRKLRATATVGVSQVNINRKSLLATVVPVPPVEEQNAIVSILNAVSRKEEVELRMADHLTEVKSALMSVLLTGELRVTSDPETA